MVPSFRSRWRVAPSGRDTPAGVDMDVAGLSVVANSAVSLTRRFHCRAWYPEDLPQQRQQSPGVGHGHVGLPGDRARAAGTDRHGEGRPAGALRPGVDRTDSGQVAEVVACVAGVPRIVAQELTDRCPFVQDRNADLENFLSGADPEPGRGDGFTDRGPQYFQDAVGVRGEPGMDDQ